MYTTARRLASISSILCAVNIMGLIMYILASAGLSENFTMNLAILMYMITTSLVLLLLSIGLRSLCQDLDFQYESQAKRFREIKENIHEIKSTK